MSSKFIDPKEYFPEITDAGVKDLLKLVEIVYNCHFTYASEHKEDLYAIGYLKAIEYIKSGLFDPSRSSLKNVLYTGIRNDMKNYLYKLSHDIPVDDEVMIGVNEAEGPRVDDIILLGKIKLPRCREMKKVYSTLQYYGFDLGVEPIKYEEVERWMNIAIYQMIRESR